MFGHEVFIAVYKLRVNQAAIRRIRMVLIHSFGSVCCQAIIAVEDAEQLALNGGYRRFQSRHVTFIGIVLYQTNTVICEIAFDYID
jgi:hypothetical protein